MAAMRSSGIPVILTGGYRPRLWKAAGCLSLSVGLTVPLGAAAALPALTAGTASTASASASRFTASAGTSRQGYIPISGRVKLAYDLTLPAAAGRFPVALEYNDYTAGTDNSAGVPGSDAGRLLAAGFAVLGVNQPGSGCSGGVNDITDVNEWGSAGAQVVEWAASQPWSTGHVGMFGSSWTGITQLGVASFRPKGLDAITPFHITGDLYRDFAYPGGIYNATFVNDYSVGLVNEDAQAAEPGIKRGDQQCIRDFRSHVKANRRYSLAPNALAHPFDDAYWQASPASGISRIDVPVLGCQSWQDGIASSRATELYSDAFNKKTSWFVGMNGPHGICESDQPLTMMVNFLRHYVAGADNGWPKTPHITILHQVSAASSKPAWTSTYNSWSTVVEPVTLFFHADGSLAAAPAQQSQLVLGLIPGATAKAPLPACDTIAGEPCRPNAVPVPPGRLTIP